MERATMLTPGGLGWFEVRDYAEPVETMPAWQGYAESADDAAAKARNANPSIAFCQLSISGPLRKDQRRKEALS